MTTEKEDLIPPERFANLFRDAGINNLETLAHAFRLIADQTPETKAPLEDQKKPDA